MKKSEYRHLPPVRGKRCLILCIALLCGAVLSFVCASFFPLSRALGQFLSVVFLLLFVQISNRYLLTRYGYLWEDGMLSFFRKQGSRQKPAGQILIGKECRLFTKEEWKKEKKAYPVKNRFSFTQNMSPDAIYYLLIPDEKGPLLLSFEPDEQLLSLIRRKIEE